MKALTGIPVGISAFFWLFMGITRIITEFFKPKKRFKNKLNKKDIAVILPAHNEEPIIKSSIKALKRSLPTNNIYVVSDGSQDKTYKIAQKENVHVSNLKVGQGKSKAIAYVIKRYKLTKRYRLIFIVDADTRIGAKFVKTALPFFNDPEISVVFGSSYIHWPKSLIPKLGFYFVAYRERLNQILRTFYSMGQTWKYTNACYVIPGFAAMYRSKILGKLTIDKEGLLIEDFNLAFELYKKKLGKVAFNPSLVAWDQHPDNLRDYWEQVQRWNIGFFQTVKLNGIWPSFFWLSLGVFTIEVFINSLMMLFLPIVLFLILYNWFSSPDSTYQTLLDSYLELGFLPKFTFIYIAWAFIFDYIITVILAIIGKKPQLLFYGLFFVFMHFITSLILMSSIIPGFFSTTKGRWTSPKRISENIT